MLVDGADDGGHDRREGVVAGSLGDLCVMDTVAKPPQLSRGTRGLSYGRIYDVEAARHRIDGVEAARHRVDAVAATALR